MSHDRRKFPLLQPLTKAEEKEADRILARHADPPPDLAALRALPHTPEPWSTKSSSSSDPMQRGDVAIAAGEAGPGHLGLIGEIWAERRQGHPDALQATADAAYIVALVNAAPRLIELAELGAAWTEVEATLPEDWELELSVGGYGRHTATAKYAYSLRYYRENVGRARSVPFEMTHGSTPALALRALTAALAKRP